MEQAFANTQPRETTETPGRLDPARRRRGSVERRARRRVVSGIAAERALRGMDARRVVDLRHRGVRPLAAEVELHPGEVVALAIWPLEPVIERVGLVGQVVVAVRQARDLELLERRRLVVLVGPVGSESLEVAIALEVRPRKLLLLGAGQAERLDVDKTERDL